MDHLQARARRHFGTAFRLWPFPFSVPGAIAIAGSGFLITTRGRVLTFAIVVGLCAPAVTGALDLYLRARTP